jgi:hypothetical protein
MKPDIQNSQCSHLQLLLVQYTIQTKLSTVQGKFSGHAGPNAAASQNMLHFQLSIFPSLFIISTS